MKINAFIVFSNIFLLGASLNALGTTITTSFEQSEGFNAGNTIKSHPDWSASSNHPRAIISNAYAFDGNYSAALWGPTESSSTNVVARRNLTGNDPFVQASWSFLNPTSQFASQANAAWVYIYLWDNTLNANRELQFYLQWGAAVDASKRVLYQSVNSQGAVTSMPYNDTAGDLYSWDIWNTVSVVFDFEAKTYSLSLNGKSLSALSGISLGTWDVSRISGIQLVSPSNGVAYYDAVTFSTIPEPSTSATAFLGLSMTVLFLNFRRRSCKHYENTTPCTRE